jgi:CheY-like chemotaxis protein
MPSKKTNLFLVEDDEIDVITVRRFLKKTNLSSKLYVAKDGVEALEKLRAGAIPAPYIVLMDLNMPRMDGFNCLKEIRNDENLKRTIIFILTTSKDEKDKIKAYNYNIAGYITKSNVNGGFDGAFQMLNYYLNTVELPC